MSEIVGFNPEILSITRKRLGLTFRDLSECTNIHASTLCLYEKGHRTPRLHAWKVIYEALDKLLHAKVGCGEEAKNDFAFECEHCYSIREKWHGGLEVVDINPASGNNCVFRYKGKQGIHHCFTEASGGWTRTYTDSQLIGKEIKEVANG